MQKGREDLTRLLLSKGVSPETKPVWGVNPLHEARHAGVCCALIEAGADIEKLNPEGETALLSAVRAGAAEVVDCLIDHGADISVRDGEGLDVLDIAMSGGDDPTLEVFQNHGLFADRLVDYWAGKRCTFKQ